MWIVIRLVVMAIAIISRFLRQFEPAEQDSAGQCDAVPFYQETFLDKEKKTTGFELWYALRTDVPFQLNLENSASALFKWLGISREFQTGDAAFDQHIYLACDHPVILQNLQLQATARQAIVALLELPGAKKIWSDGYSLRFTRLCDHESTEADQAMLLQLVRALEPVVATTRQQPVPFFWRYTTIEALVWGLFGYASVTLAEYYLINADYHLDSTAVLQMGLLAGLAMFSFLMLLIVLFLRGSSRSHQIVTESFFLLIMALPVCGTQAISDINRSQDQAKAEMVLVPIKGMHSSERRKGPDVYYLYLATPPRLFGTRVPNRIEVTYDIYHKAAVDKQLLLVVKPGRLGLPWYQRMDVYPQHAELRLR